MAYGGTKIQQIPQMANTHSLTNPLHLQLFNRLQEPLEEHRKYRHLERLRCRLFQQRKTNHKQLRQLHPLRCNRQRSAQQLFKLRTQSQRQLQDININNEKLRQH